MSFQDRLNVLYKQLNQHLASIQLLFHQQQVQYFQRVIEVLLPEIKGCTIHYQQLIELNNIILNLDTTSRLHEVLVSFQKFLSYPVEDNCQTIIRKLRTHLEIYIDLVSQQSPPQSLPFSDLTDIDGVNIYQKIIDPLSNQKRLEIMLTINHGRKRFKELEIELDLQAGHLIYHLNPLKNGNYIDQDNKKNYKLTDKGLEILQSLSRIHRKYSEEISPKKK